MPYLDPKTGQEVTLPGDTGAQNLAANKAGYDYVPVVPKTEPTTTPQLFSSDKGKTIIDTAKEKEAKLTTPTTTTTTTPTPPPTPTPTTTSKVSLVNEAGQTIDFENPDLNKSNIEAYLKSGYSLKGATGQVPSWLTPTPTGATVTQPTKAEADLATAKAERDAMNEKLKNFNVSNDPALQSLLTGISAGWETRIKEMERSNVSRAAALGQTGVRLGSRYTGGAGGMFGSIISAEERASTDRIASLEGQKQAALSEAKNAYETKEWNKYAKLVDLADKAYTEQLGVVKDLNKAQADQDKLIQEKKDARTKENNEILKSYTEGGGKDIATIAAIQSAESIGEAIAYAGDYLQKGTGDVADYLFAKREALNSGSTVPTYETWKDNLDKQKLETELAKLRATEGIKFDYDLALEKAKKKITEGPTPNYNDEFAATIKLASNAGGTKDQRTGIKADMENFVSQGDYRSAYTQIVQSVGNILKGTAATTFQERTNQLDVVKDLKTQLQNLAATGYDTNLLKGKADDIQNQLGILMTDPKYAAVATQLTIAFQNYRMEMSGAAFGEQESAQYASVLPQKDNTLSLNLAKIDGLSNYLNSVTNSAIKNAVGPGGIYIKERAMAAQETVDQGKSKVERITKFREANPDKEDMMKELRDSGFTEDQIIEQLHI